MSKKPYKKAHLEEYIDLILRSGINIQPGQELVINSSVDSAFFARRVMAAAFELGASNVHLRWDDDISARTKYLMASDAVFDKYPSWEKLMLDTLSDEGAAFLSIVSRDPEAFRGVDSSRLSRYNVAAMSALKGYYEKVMSHKIRWSIAAVPSAAWAEKVFPGASSDEAVASLWKNIFAAARVGSGGAVEKWKIHVNTLKNLAATLNKHKFTALHFKNKAGTDLLLGLPKNHIWTGGGDVAKDGHAFLPNIPTEEIFTAPHADKASGKVVGTMPNVFRGNLIKGFSLTFENGKVVAFDAKDGREHLEKMVTDTKGMDRLGEVALVEHGSPISKTGILFYNTLFDENASCHLALGRAYPDCIEGGVDMTAEERCDAGLNYSDSHHDFMFGSKDMTITGITESGDEVAVFKGGRFATGHLKETH